MVDFPPNPPRNDLYEVSAESLKKDDEIYLWYKFGRPQWKVVKFIEYFNAPGYMPEVLVESDIGKEGYNGEFLEYGILRLFKQESPENKLTREKVKLLEKSILGFNGPPMNLIRKFVNIKKIQGEGGRRKTRRRRQRRSRKN